MSIISGSELYDFYAHLGQALYLIQHVENSLHKALCVRVDFRDGPVSQADADAALERYRRLALGALIGRCRTNQIFSDETLTVLEGLNRNRRIIVHRLSQEAEYRLRTDAAWRFKTIKFLDELGEDAISLNGRLVGEFLEAVGPEVTDSERFKSAFDVELTRSGFRR